MAELWHNGKNEDISDESKQELMALGRTFFLCLIPKEHPLFSTSQYAYGGSQTISQLESQDDTNLRNFVHTITTGLGSELSEKERPEPTM